MAAQRVGGGYSYGVDQVSGSPRRPKPVAPKGAVSSVVKEFEAAGVRAIEVLQGGATLWTAEEDGSIAVRNGFTGEIAHRTQPSGAGLVERLYATTSYMWVGFNDGGVKVYDHLVVDEEWPSSMNPLPETDKPHTGPVHFFCPAYDGSMLSGSTDGLIIKWAAPERMDEDEENRNPDEPAPFTHIQKSTPSSSLTALEAYSTFVFTGDLQGKINVLDSEYLQPLRVFEAHPSATVTCLKYMDGMLFSGGSEGLINAWAQVTQRVPDRQPIGEEGWHDCPIRKLIGDPRAHQMWSIDDSGRVHKWESTAPFGPRNSQTEDSHIEGGAPLECGPFRDLSTFATWDAVRVWSTGSNGANFSWFAQWSRAEEQMQEAIDSMQVIINRDQAGLDSWQKFIDNIMAIDKRRTENLAHTLLVNTKKGLLYVYKRKWAAWLAKKHEINRRMAVSECLARSMTTGLIRVYYDKMNTITLKAKKERQKLAMVESIMCTTKKGLRRAYWKKINAYRFKKKKEQHKRDLAEALVANSEKGLLRKYFRKCLRFVDRMKIRAKREQVAGSLLRSCDSGLLRIYFFKLMNWRQVAKRKTKRAALAETMMNNSRRGMQRVYFLKFWKWGQGLRDKEKKKALAEMLKRNTEKGLLATYQQKCEEWLNAHMQKKKENELEEKTKRLEELLKQQEAEKERMKRIEALDELRKRRDELKKRRDELQGNIDAMKAGNDDIRDQIQKKKDSDEDIRATREKLNDVMAKLKEVALNFDQDHQLIITTTDKCKSIPVHKVFLSAHMEVKRVVVTLLGKSDLPQGEEWQIYGKFKKIEKFQYSQIHKAIKTLVITFDIMTLKDLAMLETDDEIVANASNLMKLYENAVRVKARQPPIEYPKSKAAGEASPAKKEAAEEEKAPEPEAEAEPEAEPAAESEPEAEAEPEATPAPEE
eukprot:TRINITY_DN21974_c0_g1_i3.p1 TRINITY_DN21974_c0_g1~~TRINITY_DN21974_c0_g1_i3.p1  ORF type:complete len:941 (+),score=440.19 TRINITY_DN21974_c0_g1_i3:38-2824(+)